jgi:hypothetical protein
VRAAAQKGIDDAVYGLMMVIEGVTCGLSNSSHMIREFQAAETSP